VKLDGRSADPIPLHLGHRWRNPRFRTEETAGRWTYQASAQPQHKARKDGHLSAKKRGKAGKGGQGEEDMGKEFERENGIDQVGVGRWGVTYDRRSRTRGLHSEEQQRSVRR
jgi:glutamate synthase domain-containing protein 2